jgi:hypothetical protein
MPETLQAFHTGIKRTGASSACFMLWLKGYKCIGFRQMDMPSNWVPLHPGLRQKVIESILGKQSPGKKLRKKLLSGRKVWRGLISLPVDLMVSPVAWLG